jgi:uncharacterized membrane protein
MQTENPSFQSSTPQRLKSRASQALARADGAVTPKLKSPSSRALALGWFSIGLGLTQLVAPSVMAQLVGASVTRRSRSTMRALGVRELGAGLFILARPRRSGALWARVAGDVMDVVLLTQLLDSRKTVRSRVAAAGAAVAGVTLLDALTAVELGRARSEPVLDTTAIQVTRSITVNRPPEEVYRFWRNFENFPRFMAHLKSVEVSGSHSRWRASAPAGMSVEWKAEMVVDRPNEAIAWRSLPGSEVPNEGAVRFVAAPGGRGTEVHVELRYEPPAGRLGALLAKLFGEEPSQQVASDLRRFKQVLETGEVVHSDASVHRGMHAAQPSNNGASRLGQERMRK